MQPLVQVQHAGAVVQTADPDLRHVVELVRCVQPLDIGLHGREARKRATPPPGDLDHRIVDIDRGDRHAGGQELLSEKTRARAKIQHPASTAHGVDMGIDQGPIAGKLAEDTFR